ncbi:hypothetical protein ACE1TI_14085 [Alteribacillus sp. JSM 102045]|uniref:hypothetical protein n=1 Tax=Alteribacillus sp. JSM 102045 TaxID=1562101 RepID=UPI0035C17F19
MKKRYLPAIIFTLLFPSACLRMITELISLRAAKKGDFQEITEPGAISTVQATFPSQDL